MFSQLQRNNYLQRIFTLSFIPLALALNSTQRRGRCIDLTDFISSLPHYLTAIASYGKVLLHLVKILIGSNFKKILPGSRSLDMEEIPINWSGIVWGMDNRMLFLMRTA